MTLPGYRLTDQERFRGKFCACGLWPSGDPNERPPERPPTERIFTEGGLWLNTCSRCGLLRKDG